MKPQAKTLLQELLKRPLTTKAIRDVCGISSVAGSVYELRESGVPITTALVPAKTRHGGATVALYTLPRTARPSARRLLSRAA